MANIVPRSNGNVTLTFNNGGLAVREARRTTYDTHLQPGALVHFPMAAAAAAAANYQPLPSPAKHVVKLFLYKVQLIWEGHNSLKKSPTCLDTTE